MIKSLSYHGTLGNWAEQQRPPSMVWAHPPSRWREAFLLHRLAGSCKIAFMGSFSRTLKRLADIVATLLVGPLALLLGLFIALVIRMDSHGPVIFRQQRAGKGNQPFTLLKFRTMKTGIDPFGPSPKNGTDNRLTRVGRFLRASSLDELPQFWNVLKADMSLVGPRPLYMAQAKQWNQRQQRRLAVMPGLTGLAQVNGRGGLTIEEKLEFDVQYVEKQSLWLDAKIILATMRQVFFRRDVYEKRYSAKEETRNQD